MLALFFMAAEAYSTKYHHTEKQADNAQLFLSMLVAPHALMFAVSTQNFRNVIELCHVELQHNNSPFDITSTVSLLVNDYLLHRKKFEKVNISFLNSEFTLVPDAFASESDAKSVLTFTTGSTQIKRALQHSLKNFRFCYSVDLELIGFFEKTFPNASVRHAGAVNISLFFSQHSIVNSDLFLNIGDGCIELAAKQKNDMIFYNMFNSESDEDILYYILFTMEQFRMDPLNTKLAIAGQRSASDDLIKNIRKYIRHVAFSVSNPSVVMKGELSTLPGHYYFTLLNQHACEL